MKIDICSSPPADIFRNRGRHLRLFIFFLLLACCGLLLGAYAVVAETHHYEAFETAALALFAGSALFLTYFGEKLQAYKRLTPPQYAELAGLAQNHAAIGLYCELVAKAGREPIRAEFEACRDWAEEKEQRSGC